MHRRIVIFFPFSQRGNESAIKSPITRGPMDIINDEIIGKRAINHNNQARHIHIIYRDRVVPIISKDIRK